MPVDDDIRSALNAGKPVSIDRTLPREARVVPIEWLEQAIAASGRLNVSGAILAEKLTLRNLTDANEIRLQNCLLEQGLTVEYCSFANLFDLSGSVALQAVILNASRFSSDVSFQNVRLRGPADTLALAVCDCTFEGVVEAPRLRVHGARQVVFMRVTFRSSIELSRSWLTGDLQFTAVEIGRDLVLDRAVIGGAVQAARTHISGTIVLHGVIVVGDFVGFAATLGRVIGRKARLRGQLRLSYALIAGFVFLEQCHLDKGATFEAARISGGLFLSATQFGDSLILSDAVVGGSI